MGLLTRLTLGVVLTALPRAAGALSWDIDVDARAVIANADQSFLDGGLGKFRYNDGNSAHIGRLRVELEQRLGEKLRLVADASYWGDRGPHPLDLTEAFAEYRSFPHNAWRTRFRVGAFYPPSSLENRAAGWESPYSISSSALNSWIAEEIRAIGAEVAVDRLGSKAGRALDWGVFAGVFGWNDPAGVLIANHGFGLHDRQTRLHDHLGPVDAVAIVNRQLFYEIDDRAGFYVGGKLRLQDRVEARAMHYDNRADPTISKPSINDIAWRTAFDTAGLRVEIAPERTVLAQWLNGRTTAAPYDTYRWHFATWNLLANQRWGAQGVSVRYDKFRVHMVLNGSDPATQSNYGSAWTLAYAYERDGAPWRFMAEIIRVDSVVTDRRDYLALSPQVIESKLELSLRYRLSGEYHQ